jgi:hypothetical protein
MIMVHWSFFKGITHDIKSLRTSTSKDTKSKKFKKEINVKITWKVLALKKVDNAII